MQRGGWGSRAALPLALTIAACDRDTVMTLPDPPAPLTRTAEYAWGDRVAAAEERMKTRVAAALAARFGRPRETLYTVRAGSDPAAVQSWYAERARDAGWTELPAIPSALRPGEGGFGFAQGDRALAILWLTSKDGGPTPVTVMRFGEEPER